MIRLVRAIWLPTAFILLTCQPSPAQERLCDPSFEDCYTPLIQTVQAETAGIDVALYAIELPGLADAVISRHQAGVLVRITVEPRASLKFPGNQTILDRFKPEVELGNRVRAVCAAAAYSAFEPVTCSRQHRRTVGIT